MNLKCIYEFSYSTITARGEVSRRIIRACELKGDETTPIKDCRCSGDRKECSKGRSKMEHRLKGNKNG